MTGRYPSLYGLHASNVLPNSPFGLPLTETLMPQVMQKLGYATHHVGKWHLRHCNKKMIPVERGYNSSFGPYIGSMDLYSHLKRFPTKKLPPYSTMHIDTEPVKDYRGWYATDMFTAAAQTAIGKHYFNKKTKNKPLFMTVFYTAPHSPLAPHSYARFFRKPTNYYGTERRKRNLGLLYGMDVGIKKIVETLKSQCARNNTLLVFTFDNGGVYGQAMNYPLRGAKGKYFEGGTGVPMMAYHPCWHSNGGYRVQSMMHFFSRLAGSGRFAILELSPSRRNLYSSSTCSVYRC